MFCYRFRVTSLRRERVDIGVGPPRARMEVELYLVQDVDKFESNMFRSGAEGHLTISCLLPDAAEGLQLGQLVEIHGHTCDDLGRRVE